MRIAHVAPLYESVPPKLYGGTERIVSYSDRGAGRDLGHEVALFASGDSQTSAAGAWAGMRASLSIRASLKSETAAHLSMLAEVRERADEFEIIHFHLSHFLHFSFFRDIAERTMTTPHGRLDYVDLAPAYRKFPRFPMIASSHSQRSGLADANWLATIHHGLPTSIYEPTFEPAAAEPYLAFLGRDDRARRASRSPVRAETCWRQDRRKRPCLFYEAVELLIDGDRIDYIGEIEEDRKAEFLGNSAGLLFPIDWPEPFGLAAIEAMACGTPVIAWNCGALPEIVDQGVTGFVAGSIDEAVAFFPGLLRLDRRKVRAAFEKRFSAARMARDYVAAYSHLTGVTSQAKAS
jgi:glycosyltransferase involved in cell wall biosynthesis